MILIDVGLFFIYLVTFIYLASSNKQCSLIPPDFAHHIEKCSSGVEGEGKRGKRFVRELNKSEREKKHESLSFFTRYNLEFLCCCPLFNHMCSLIYTGAAIKQ